VRRQRGTVPYGCCGRGKAFIISGRSRTVEGSSAKGEGNFFFLLWKVLCASPFDLRNTKTESTKARWRRAVKVQITSIVSRRRKITHPSARDGPRPPKKCEGRKGSEWLIPAAKGGGGKTAIFKGQRLPGRGGATDLETMGILSEKGAHSTTTHSIGRSRHLPYLLSLLQRGGGALSIN